MKRLFLKFEKETGFIADLIKQLESPHRIMGIENYYGQISTEFNKWRAELWNRVAPANPSKAGNIPDLRVRTRYNVPFGNRINQFMIRKWTEKLVAGTL